jgi:putative ABC transport system permease protein
VRAPLLRAVRELRSTWGQSLGLALLVAVTTLALAGGHRARRILFETREAWQRDLALADVELRYSPTHADVAAPVRGLPGVAAVETRLLVTGRLSADGMADVSALVRVLPPGNAPALDRLQLVEGRWPHEGETAAVVDRSLTALHGLEPGGQITLTVGTHVAHLPIVGTAVSVEHLLYPIHPEYALPLRGALAVVHVSRAAAVAQVEGAATLTDSLLVRFAPGTEPRAATRAVVEALTTPLSAVIPRDEQASARVLTMLFSVFDAYLPLVAAVLAGVALLLLTLTVARRVRRATLEIGALLAIGHGARRIASAAMLGALLPTLAGGLLGAALHGVFAQFIVATYRTSLGYGPLRDPGPGPELLVVVGAALLAAGATGWLVAWKTTGRPPARLLRAGDASAVGGAAVRTFAGLGRFLPTSMLLGLSQPLRHPLSASLATIGLGALLATVLAFLGVQRAYEANTTDAARRSGLDAVVRLSDPVPEAALADLAGRAHGRVEPLVTGIALLRGAVHEGFVQVVGLGARGWAQELRIVAGRGLAGTPGEVLVDRWTSDLRGVRLGERVTLFRSLSAPEGVDAQVVGIVETLSAGRAYLALEDARALLDLAGLVNGAQVASPLAADELERALDAAPAVENATSFATALREITAMFAGGRKIVGLALCLTVLLSMLFLGVVGAMDAQERMPDVAVLHALGWRDRSLRALLLTEVAFRGVLAVTVGLSAAPLLSARLLARLSEANHFTLNAVSDPWIPAALALFCMLALPLAAWPAWRAVHSLAPARALRLLARE